MSLLSQHLDLRGLRLRNRSGLAPMCMYSCAPGTGLVNQFHAVHLGARALGGFGLIITEATAVVPEGRICDHDAGLWDDTHVDAWRPVFAAVRSGGAASCVQLAHAGRKGSIRRGFPGEPTGVHTPDQGGWQVVAPSPVPFPGLTEPRALTVAEIDDIVTAFESATTRAVAAGADTVEIHAAHGYLLHQFLSPLANHRTDEYGGSFDNRIRLLLRVVDTCRAALPDDAPLLVRLSTTDWAEGGWDITDSVALAPLLREHGVDLIDCSSGGMTPTRSAIPVGPDYQVPYAGQVRATGIATAAVGLITEAEQAERILREEMADVVLLGREALRQPTWVMRALAQLGDQPPYPPQYARAPF